MEKLLKYTDVTEEITRIRHLNAIYIVLLALPTTNTIHTKTTPRLETAQSSPWSIRSDAENSDTECMSYSYKVFSRIMNKKNLQNDS